MHGKIFQSLKNFIIAKENFHTWEDICDKADVSKEPFLPIKTYPDEKIYDICKAASKHFQLSVDDFIHQFGIHLMEDLILFCDKWLDPSWKCLDFLENTECVMHSTVKKLCAIPGEVATPPCLQINRVSEDELTIIYNSPRKLCALAKGLLVGAAKHYKEEIEISELSCMHLGLPECVFDVRKKN